MDYLLVALGASAGGTLRYAVSLYFAKNVTPLFPLGTLAVNILGSLILGIVVFMFGQKLTGVFNIRLLLGVGFCGGLTTFSTFSLETFNLIKNAEFLLAVLNIASNLIFTLIGIYLGYLLAR